MNLKRPRWLTSHPRSRRNRPCDSATQCEGVKRGDRYERAVLPPRVEPNSGRHWYATAWCEPCATAAGRPFPEVTR